MARTHTYTKAKQRMPWMIGGLAVFLFFSFAVFWLLYPFPSNEKTDYFNTQYPLIFKGKKYTGEVLYEDGIYLSFDFVKEYIDSELHYDESSRSVIVTTQEKVYQMPSNTKQYYINNESTQLSFPAVKTDQGNVYVSSDWMSEVYPVQIEYHDNTTAVSLYENEQILQQGAVTAEGADERRVRTEPTVTSSYVSELKREEMVTIETEEEGYYFVRTEDGVGGYVKTSAISIEEPKRITVDVEEAKNPFTPSLEWPVHVTWDQLATNDPLEAMPGVQVISPTWFTLQNGEGEIRNIASESYVKNAKDKGYSIWALFSNGFDPDITKEALNSFEKRKSMIEQLLYFAEIYRLNGFNIDFENVYETDGANLTQFIRELTPLAHKEGLVVSVDVSFISGSAQWSKFYERKELAEAADYIMVMAYDEHWGSSSVAGSVSSLPWVENGLERILEEIPHEQLILGAPLYTRLWKEEMTEDGSVEVSSEAMSMEEANEWIEEYQVEPSYDPGTGQDYVQYSEEDITYKMWLENETSLQKRALLVHQYQLAGLATWSQTFATDEAFQTIEKALKKRKMIEKE
ncbi:MULTISPECIES: glycosyl hydrolase family 18 protein [Pontibacillus]|uniref:Glycosyl hydrolase family 18 protein n=1 Tax=Pontibacillus chungwhensis TaxID=265426 RepID=A0ABY8V2C6_9BACI|nr:MULTISPECIES: glycosyl hydrolase family 18 protein [Pontibacillus]MCD5322811.1 glycosyl hydrolase family 18 protein [Pontibacillus sp. HN14]WIG00081.1 glycosyl hydrolase family 18 protein [Pontibacillus chungwhensis]